MNILMIGGGVVAAGLIIVAAKKSYGSLMAGIQGIMAIVLIFNGILLAPEEPLSFGIACVLFILITGYYFVPKLLLESRIDSKNKTLQNDSDFNIIFGRELGEMEESIVRLWISTFGTSLYDTKRIKVAPYVDESLFDDGDKKLFALSKEESILFHYESLEMFTVWVGRAAGKQGVVITTKGIYWGYAKHFWGSSEDDKHQIYFKDILINKARIIPGKGWAGFPTIALGPDIDENSGFNFSGLAGTSEEGSDKFLRVVLDFILGVARMSQY